MLPNTNVILSLRSSGFVVSSVPLKKGYDKLYIHVDDNYERENAMNGGGTNTKKNVKLSVYRDIKIDVSIIGRATADLTLVELYRGSHPRSDSSLGTFSEMITSAQFVDFYHEAIRINREEADTAHEGRAVPTLVETIGVVIDESLKIAPLF